MKAKRQNPEDTQKAISAYHSKTINAAAKRKPRSYPEAALQRVKPLKYRNAPTVVGGVRFASRAEAKRYLELRALERAKKIVYLQIQPRFLFEVRGQKICTYVGDFSYFEDARQVVEDVKGFETEAFKIKAKLFAALYPHIELRIVRL